MKSALLAGATATAAAALLLVLLSDRADPRFVYWLLVPIVGLYGLRALNSSGLTFSVGKLWPLFRRTGIEADPGIPKPLRRAERLVIHGPRDAQTASHRLLPTLRDLATDRLQQHAGIDFDHPDAKRILGSEVWSLLSPTWSAERDSSSPGPKLAELEQAVTAIEEIS